MALNPNPDPNPKERPDAGLDQIVDFTESSFFDNGITIVIILNVLCMCIEHEGQPADMTSVLRILNYIFTAIFAIEAIFKMKAFGLTCYFSDGWNKVIPSCNPR